MTLHCLWFVFFCIVTVFWTYRSFATPRKSAGFSRYRSLYHAGQAMMSTGMAIMFGALLFNV
nr:DUF5134 domain-containing protein [Mycobacterium lepromatosis]